MRFNKVHILGMLGTIVIATSIVGLLAWASSRDGDKTSSFSRNFIPKPLTRMEAMIKPDEVVDFAGITAHSIYFRTKNAAKLLLTDHNLKNQRQVNLSLPKDNAAITGFNTIVDSPNVRITMGSMPAMISINAENQSTFSRFPNTLFTKSIAISENCMIFRMFEKADQIFVKGNAVTGQLVKEKNISEKNNDAGISTDGMLQYDQTTNLLTYVFYYRNQFLCMDTNLNLIYKENTIDKNTISKTNIKSSSNNTMTNNAPNYTINGRSTVSNGYLFVNSKTKSKNEKTETFSGNSAIDFYKIKDGAYAGSFYIPPYKGEKMNRMRIINDKVIVIYNKYIISYKLEL